MRKLIILIVLGIYQQIEQNTANCNKCLCYQLDCTQVVTADIDCFDLYTDTCSSTIDIMIKSKCQKSCDCCIFGECQNFFQPYCFYQTQKDFFILLNFLLSIVGGGLLYYLRYKMIGLYRAYVLEDFHILQPIIDLEEELRKDKEQKEAEKQRKKEEKERK